MSDMGWSQYIARQEDAADMEMQADDDLGTRIKEQGLVSVLADAVVDYTRATGQTINQPALRECLYAVVERFCTRHANTVEWHDTFTRPMCGPRPNIDPVASILDLP